MFGLVEKAKALAFENTLNHTPEELFAKSTFKLLNPK